MRIAVPIENGQVFQHFGQSRMFCVYTAENGTVTDKTELDTSMSGHSALAGFLKGAAVDALICGGIGGGAKSMLEEVGIKLVAGIAGPADAAVQAYLRGELQDKGLTCNHHEHGHGDEHHGHGHTCSCHSH